MRIGILTFHRAKNFGAVLQCYALCRFLSSHGFDVQVINYQPSYLAGYRKKNFTQKIKGIFKFSIYWILSKGETKYIDGFDHFIEKFIPLCDFNKKEDVDVYICGSDQIWSTTICNGFDPVFFARFPQSKHKTKISYAASMGKTTLTNGQQETLKSYLSDFNAVSVREESLKELLKKIDIPCSQVLDPVLLVNRKILEELVIPIRQKHSFVLVYEIVHLENTISFARHIAKQVNADVVLIGGGVSKCFSKGVINKQNYSPEQFVSYFKSASCVVTTSFHGTAFALQFEKPFYSLKMNSYKDDRILSLLKSVGLTHRSVESGNRIHFEPIDYTESRKKLACLQNLSSSFLLSALK